MPFQQGNIFATQTNTIVVSFKYAWAFVAHLSVFLAFRFLPLFHSLFLSFPLFFRILFSVSLSLSLTLSLSVASLCYRLGALGFLRTNNPLLPGNLVLLDQIFAINWTRQYISYV